MIDNLVWLQKWYNEQCDGDWEHGNGVKIGTIDNPGWYLKVSLDETDLQERNFQIIDIDRAENDWLYCSVSENTFKGYGGPFNLLEILHIFRDWVES